MSIIDVVLAAALANATAAKNATTGAGALGPADAATYAQAAKTLVETAHLLTTSRLDRETVE